MYKTQPERYIESAAKLKILDTEDSEEFTALCKRAFTRVYRAVALDVDGTITDQEGAGIEPAMAQIVARLLKKGIPVILISGRGRSSVKEAAEHIRRATKISDWYLRRLQCVGYNGAFRLYTRSSRPDHFLELYENLVEISEDQKTILKRFITGNHENIDKALLEFGFVRIKEKSAAIRSEVQKHMSGLADGLRILAPFYPWEVSKSTYSGTAYWTLSATDKSLALTRIAERLGLPQNTILRIGDSGDESGNDATLLNCDSGFSVGTLSRSKSGCLPIINSVGEQLIGVDATRELIHSLHIFPPLSLHAGVLEKRIEDLTGFEKLVTLRSRSEAKSLENQINAKHQSQLSTGDRIRMDTSMPINDLYDLRSGAVKIRFWELEYIYKNAYIAVELFALPSKLSDLSDLKGLRSFALFSDTSLLLRGPAYYWSLSVDIHKDKCIPSEWCRSGKSVGLFTEIHMAFFEGAGKLLKEDWMIGYNMVALKIALAILDQIRNFTLSILYVDFLNDRNNLDSSDAGVSQSLFDLLVSVSDLTIKLLFDMDFSWERGRSTLENLCATCIKISNSQPHQQLVSWANIYEGEVFKYRECDHFLQNLAATQIALRDFVRHDIIPLDQTIIVYGLAYGGIELPAICQTVGSRMGIKILPRYAKVSLYGTKEVIREQVYLAGPDYIDSLSDGIRERSYFPESEAVGVTNCLILDDNCTTCATLQLARDILVTKGYYVLGCVAVRYPSTNRLLHMGLKAHGFPDPENLLSFVRGLIAPCPYSRLLREAPESPYVDESGVFDKSKARIGRYLAKHLNLKGGEPS